MGWVGQTKRVTKTFSAALLGGVFSMCANQLMPSDGGDDRKFFSLFVL